ncbi:MAG: methyl-accepting chemotaxis protein, partial [Treponema sp.]|nr:methyl-accepting chemotaxis protein [Treponema sp.]
MLAPIIGLLVLFVFSIVVFVYDTTGNLIDSFEDERMAGATQSVRAYLEAHRRTTLVTAIAMGNSMELIRRIDAGDRLAVWEYVLDRKEALGVDEIIVANHEGITLARSHLRDSYGDDVSGVPSIAAGLRRENITIYTPTPTAEMVMTSTAPILDEDRLVGSIVVNFVVGSNDFLDRLADVFGVDFTVFRGDLSVATTLLHPVTGARLSGTRVAPHVADAVLGRGEHLPLELNILGMMPYLAYYFPLYGVGNNRVGMFFIGIPRDYAIEVRNALLRNLILIGGAGLVVIALVLLLFVVRMLKPIGLLTRTLEIAADGDLTKRLPEVGRDEIARASRSFNKTMEEFRKMITSIKTQAGTLADIGNDLSSNMTETASAMHQITANIQTIKGSVMNQSATVSETHATMEQVVANINKLSAQVENQSVNISQAAPVIEQLVLNTKSVTETLIKDEVNVKTLMEASEVGRGGLSEVSADIQEIARESEGLMEINSVMENIASQTNLLSMNAAIEAAHAGDAGKGFAVVADEIRKLAETSSEQSKIISTVLKKIKGSIEKITVSTDNVLDKFEAIDSSVKIV